MSFERLWSAAEVNHRGGRVTKPPTISAPTLLRLPFTLSPFLPTLLCHPFLPSSLLRQIGWHYCAAKTARTSFPLFAFPQTRFPLKWLPSQTLRGPWKDDKRQTEMESWRLMGLLHYQPGLLLFVARRASRTSSLAVLLSPFWTRNERIIPAAANLPPTHYQQLRLSREEERKNHLRAVDEHEESFVRCWSVCVFITCVF